MWILSNSSLNHHPRERAHNFLSTQCWGSTAARGVPVSLSRLNHWLPWSQTHPEVMQSTTEFHDQIADAILPQTDAVLDNATALDATVDMLDAEPTVVQGLIGQFLLLSELLAAWLLCRHQDIHLGERERQEPEILQQLTPDR